MYYVELLNSTYLTAYVFIAQRDILLLSKKSNAELIKVNICVYMTVFTPIGSTFTPVQQDGMGSVTIVAVHVIHVYVIQ